MIRKWMTLPAAGMLLLCLQNSSSAQAAPAAMPTDSPATEAASAATPPATPPATPAVTPAVTPPGTPVQQATLESAPAASSPPLPVPPPVPLPVLPPVLPNAPQQQQTAQQPANILQQTGQEIDKGFYFFLSSKPSKYSTTLKPGQKFVPYTVKEKWIYTARESVSTESILVIVTSAAFNQWIDGNPHAGSDLGGYGDRLGYIALRNTSSKVFSDGIYASMLHTDERYWRLGPGNSFKDRTRHAIIASFVAHRDRDGSPIFDYAGIGGRASASFLTMAYYPASSSSAAVAGETFGYSLLGEIAGNAFLEFWPDLVHKITKGKKY